MVQNFKSIPMSKLIKVLSSVIKATGRAIDLNGVILSDNSNIPVGSIISIGSKDAAKSKFGSSSDEYTAAVRYFNRNKLATSAPSQLFFARHNRQDSNASIIGNNTNLTLADLKSVSGNLTVSINGQQQTANINLSASTSFSNACELIQSELTGVTVTYDAITKQFKITVTGGKADETAITLATGSAADSLGLSDETGALVSIGSLASTPGDSLDSVNKNTLNWVAFTTLFEATNDEHLGFSAWVSAQDRIYNYVMWTSSGTAKNTNSTTTPSYDINRKNYSGVSLNYYENFELTCALLGYIAATDFDGKKVQGAYREFEGLPASSLDGDDYDGLTSNGYNFYGNYSASINSYPSYQPGRVTGDFMWIDDLIGGIWISANAQLVTFNLLKNNSNIPYNAQGKARLEACLGALFEQFKGWDGCVPGTDFDATQIDAINTYFGYTGAADAVSNKGYLVKIGQLNAAMRSARATPPCYMVYAVGGAFREITLNSVEVQ